MACSGPVWGASRRAAVDYESGDFSGIAVDVYSAAQRDAAGHGTALGEGVTWIHQMRTSMKWAQRTGEVALSPEWYLSESLVKVTETIHRIGA